MLPQVPADMAIELFSGEKAVDTYQNQSVGIIPWPGGSCWTRGIRFWRWCGQ